MKRYIPLLENNWREVSEVAVSVINELAKIISLSGITDPDEINNNPKLQDTIAKLKNAIVVLYSDDVATNEVNERYIHIYVTGNNDEGFEVEDSEDGKREISLFKFEVVSLQIFHHDDEESFIDMTEAWGSDIEEQVLQMWEDGWSDYYDIKSTENTLTNYR